MVHTEDKKYTVGFQFPAKAELLTYPSKGGSEFPWTHDIAEAKAFSKIDVETFAREKCGKYGYRIVSMPTLVERCR